MTCCPSSRLLGKASTRFNPSISAILVTALLVSLTQSGCTGSTGARRTSPNPTPSGKLTASLASLSFGNVTIGSSNNQNLSLTNSGAAAVTISEVSVSGGGFGVSGPSKPLTLGIGQSATFTATFTPSATGAATGNISVTSSQLSSNAKIALTGVGAIVAPSISTQPASQAVFVGQTATFSVIASGAAPLSYQWQKNGGANGIVWAIENTGTAVLHAYAATDLTHELYHSDQAPNGRDHFGSGNKFSTPLIADGKVFAATTNSVAVFGALP